MPSRLRRVLGRTSSLSAKRYISGSTCLDWPVSLLIEGKPADIIELSRVRVELRFVPRDTEDEPQGHVEMANRVVGRGDRQEKRPVVGELGRYPEFLAHLPDDRLARVLAILDVTAGRQPQPGLAVISEQQAPVRRVDRDEVDDEVLGRRVRRVRPEDLLPRRDPLQDVGLVGSFPRVERTYVSDEIRDQFAHTLRQQARGELRAPLTTGRGLAGVARLPAVEQPGGAENVHAAWRMAVARRVAGTYTGNPSIAALAVAGSVGAGLADRFSDLELDCYWVRPPTDADRLRPVGAVGGSLRPCGTTTRTTRSGARITASANSTSP